MIYLSPKAIGRARCVLIHPCEITPHESLFGGAVSFSLQVGAWLPVRSMMG